MAEVGRQLTLRLEELSKAPAVCRGLCCVRRNRDQE
jgi:hypothetical protein